MGKRIVFVGAGGVGGYVGGHLARTGQDIVKGRRTEIDFINGLVAAKGQEVGVPAPTHVALTDMVKRVEQGLLEAKPENVAGL